MSRCFLFPPPGYEKKIPTTQPDLLKKEKHREKKHKKEKKDKDKDKDKKDRGKKDKKEKRRDKKKGKERDKDQQLGNLNNTSAETRLEVRPPGTSGHSVIHKVSDTCTLPDDHIVLGRNVGHNEVYRGHYVSLAEEPNGAEFVHSAERTLRDNAERGRGNIMREKITPTSHKRNEGGGKLYHNSHLGNSFEESSLALELDRRLKNEAEQPYDQSQTANKPVGANQMRDGGAVKSIHSRIMETGNIKMMGSNGRYTGDKSAEATLVPYACGLGQGNHDRMQRSSLESDIEKKFENQGRINHLEEEFSQQGKKRKDKERNGDRKSNEKNKSREKEKMEYKSKEQGMRENNKMDILIPPNTDMLHRGGYNISSTSNDVKMNQADGILTNGDISHVTGPSVLSVSRPASLQTENGSAPKPYRILTKPSTDVPGPSKIDKASKPNGIIRPATEQVVQARPKSPHPDAKRLADILAIPKIEELSEIDNVDWLISTKEGSGKKHKMDDYRVTTIGETPQVWSKATTIDSADVCALPYVIPY